MAKRYFALTALWFILVVGPLIAICVLTPRLFASSPRLLRIVLPCLGAFAGVCHILIKTTVKCLADRENVSTTPLVSSGNSSGYAHVLTTHHEGKPAAINAGVLPESSSSSSTPKPQVDSTVTPTPKPDFSTPETASGAVAQIQDAPAIVYIPVPPASQNAVGQFAGYIPFNLIANHGSHVENGAVEMHQFGSGHSNDDFV